MKDRNGVFFYRGVFQAYLKAFIVVSFLVPMVCGCLSSKLVNVEKNLEVYEDSSYYDSLKQATRSASVSDMLDSKFSVNVTYFSSGFKQAISERYTRLYETEQTMFKEDKINFLVSIYTNDKNISDLSDKKIWRIFLQLSGSKLEPSAIVSVSDKNRVIPFFDYCNKWTKEYMVSFDSSDPNSVVEPSLLLTNLDAKVKFSW